MSTPVVSVSDAAAAARDHHAGHVDDPDDAAGVRRQQSTTPGSGEAARAASRQQQSDTGHQGAQASGSAVRPRPRRARSRRPSSSSRQDRTAQGVPTTTNPTFSVALPGPAPIGVPNFFIEKFRIPPFLLPIYQAAGIEYGVRWEVLAAINEIETDYGRNLNVSTAGRRGLDAVHALHLEALRRRRQPRRHQGPVQPRRRDLRRRPLPEGRRRRHRHPQGDLRLQPRRLVRRPASSCARA